MERSTNALAELAEFLQEESRPSSESFKAKAIERFGIESWKRHEERKRKFSMASRIVAELAKITYSPAGSPENPLFAMYRLDRCRAIAEEGAGGGIKSS